MFCFSINAQLSVGAKYLLCALFSNLGQDSLPYAFLSQKSLWGLWKNSESLGREGFLICSPFPQKC